EREYRRERNYSRSPSRAPEYETYRYIESPEADRRPRASFSKRERSRSNVGRRSYVEEPRAGGTSYRREERRERERVVVDDGGRRTREYRR
ncbi:hypothetical protein LTR28_008361, partial [Elasticomyces elasticus]